MFTEIFKALFFLALGFLLHGIVLRYDNRLYRRRSSDKWTPLNRIERLHEYKH